MVSLSTSVQIEIERPPSDVWAYVSDLRNQNHWVDGVSDAELVGDQVTGVGTQVRVNYTMENRTTPMVLNISEFRENELLATTSDEGPFPFTGELSLAPSTNGTLVTNAMTAGSDHVVTTVMFTLLRPLSKWLFSRQLRKELRQLKAILEDR